MKVEVLVRKSLDGALHGIAPAKENGVYLEVPPGMERVEVELQQGDFSAEFLIEAVRFLLRGEKQEAQQP